VLGEKQVEEKESDDQCSSADSEETGNQVSQRLEV